MCCIHQRPWSALTIWCCLLLLIWPGNLIAAGATQPPVVAVWHVQKSPGHQQTRESFKSALKALHPVELVEIEDGNGLRTLDATKPALVFAIGSAAVEQSQEALADQPLLATMILSAATLQDRATAVLLQPSITEQLQWHRRILPHARKIGVLYNPDKSAEWVAQANKAADELDLEVLAVPVRNPQELPAALKSLARRADSILGIPDNSIYSSTTAKAVLLFSFRHRIPFIGMSGAWVKAGALYGLDWDYSDLGQQCAGIAMRIINGVDAGDIEPTVQNKLVYEINLKTAQQLKLTISDDLIAGAAEVYQ